MSVESILKASHPPDVVDALLEAYKEIESNYALRKWKTSELDSGHFVEAARRLLENVLLGAYTPIGQSLPKFNDGVLAQYEKGAGHESFRILIPRVLKAIYNIRNKRGVGHVGSGVAERDRFDPHTVQRQMGACRIGTPSVRIQSRRRTAGS